MEIEPSLIYSAPSCHLETADSDVIPNSKN